jgi:muramoyltetrapeptide carboxypeptidase LdcA involved in peptidoglycan recycling
MNRRFFLRALSYLGSALAGTTALTTSLIADEFDGNALRAAATLDEERKKRASKSDKSDHKRLIFPAGLKHGSTVGVVAPASGISREEINAGVRSLEGLGLNVVLGKSIYRGSAGFLAATDEVRAAEFMEFVQRKDIDAIITARGGYGVMRILPMLDYETIRDNPKIIMGYSDITALVNAIFARSNLIAFHGPVAAGEMDEFTRDSFVRTLFIPTIAARIASPEDLPTEPSETVSQSASAPTTPTTPTKSTKKKAAETKTRTATSMTSTTSQKLTPTKIVGSNGAARKKIASKLASTHTQKAQKAQKSRTKPSSTIASAAQKKSGIASRKKTLRMSRPGHLSRPVLAQLTDEPIHYTDSSLVNYGTTGTAGKAEGRLVGGNLTIVCALLGTPFEIQTADRILFLEEVNEEPYRIDRMLTQLWLASKLQQCAGIVLGKFSKSEASNEFTPSYNLDEVLRSRLEPLGIPVLAGFQFGHVKSKCTLPVGALAELDADAKKLTILERPVLFPES